MEKRATTLELFFDLVFVLAITQLVGFVVHDLTLGGFARGALLMAILWWSWTQYTWAGNQIDLDPRGVRLSILLAMGVAFVMAQAVPFAFEDGGIWIAGSYAALRGIGVWKQLTGVRSDPVALAAVRKWGALSLVGPLIIIIGALVDDPLRSWIWLIAAGLEVGAAFVAGRGSTSPEDWGVKAIHFTERHGLILIVALGETIVAVGLGVADKAPSLDTAVLLTVAIFGSAVLWWSYFDWIQDRLEHALAASNGSGAVARDIFSLGHYPIISGVVLYAVAAEEAFSHANDAFEPGGLIALGLSITLFFGGEIWTIYLAERRVLWDRLIGLGVALAVMAVTQDLRGVWVIAIVMAILLATLVYEHQSRRGRDRGAQMTIDEAARND